MLKCQRVNSRYLSLLHNCEENSVETLGIYSFIPHLLSISFISCVILNLCVCESDFV